MIKRYYQIGILKGLLLLLIFSNISQAIAQSPGGVGTNLVLWLKAGTGVYEDKSGANSQLAGIDGVEDGDGVQSWKDLSGVRVNAATNRANAAPTFRNNSSSNLNYHPVVEFDGVDDALDFYNDYIFSAGGATGMQIFAVLRPNNSAPSTKARQFIYDIGFVGNAGYGVLYGNTNYGFYTPLSYNGAASFPNHTRGNENTLVNFFVQFGNIQGVKFNGVLQSTANIPLLTNLTTANIDESPTSLGTFGPMSIGRQAKSGNLNSDNGRLYQGVIAEIIVYNNDLSSANIQKIENYLALKYALPLNGNYIDSDMDVVWNSTTNVTYHNDVIGIARDDNATLNQKQSIDKAGIVGIGLGSIAIDNASNPNSFALDQSYMLWGHNNGNMYSNGVSDLPTGIQARIARVWKVSEKVNGVSGNVGDIVLRMDLSSIPGNKREQDLRLLIDADGIFSSGSTTLTGTLTGNIFEVSIPGATLQDGNFFTLGSTNHFLTPLPVTILNFTAKILAGTIALNWQTTYDASLNYFLLEKSSNAKEWNTLTKMNAQTTASANVLDYLWIDNQPFEGENYYRLIQIDHNGTITKGNIKWVNFESSLATEIIIFPNPIKKDKDLQILIVPSIEKDEKIYLQIFDAKGNRILETYQTLENIHSLLRHQVKEFDSGLYILKFLVKNKFLYQKLLVD